MRQPGRRGTRRRWRVPPPAPFLLSTSQKETAMSDEATVHDEAAVLTGDGKGTREASRELRVSPATLLRMVDAGLVTVLRPTFGKKMIFPPSEIARLKREQIQWRRA